MKTGKVGHQDYLMRFKVTPIDRQLLFTALGFMSVIMRGEIDQSESVKRAKGLAWLIEQFCRDAHPEAFGESKDYSGDSLSEEHLDTLIETFKERLRNKGDAQLPEDRATLLQIHKRLGEQSADKERVLFSNESLADHILDFIDMEIDEAE